MRFIRNIIKRRRKHSSHFIISTKQNARKKRNTTLSVVSVRVFLTSRKRFDHHVVSHNRRILHVPASRPSPSRRIELENDDESGGDDAENAMLAECIQREEEEEEEQQRFGTIEENDLVIVHVGSVTRKPCE